MEKFSDTVLDKIRAQAREIVEKAEHEARQELDKARQRREQRMERERQRLLEETQAEVARIVARGRMEARNRLAAAKAGIIDEVITMARQELETAESTREGLATLIADAIQAMGSDEKVLVGVKAKNLELAREIVAEEEACADFVSEVVERPIDGGVVIERPDGAIVIDNSHNTRLEMLSPRVTVRLGKELFEQQ